MPISRCEYIIWMFLWQYVTCQHLNTANSIQWPVERLSTNNTDKTHLNIVYDTHRIRNHRSRDGIEQCGGTFRDHQVLIQSPNYPNSYPTNVHCEYMFSSPYVCTSEFHIQFLDFQLESSVSCGKDRLTIGSQTHRIETLCGQVIGIMKYKVLNGILRINFTTDATIEQSGFKLLVTRLPCVPNDIDSDKSMTAITTTISIDDSMARVSPILPTPTPSTPPTTTNQQIDDQSSQPLDFRSNSVPAIAAIDEPPVCTQQINPNPFPSAINLPLSRQLPNCCRNVFNQVRFTLISPGFPRPANYMSDCAYYIQRSHANVCRLRIEFKYLNLGERRFYGCTNSFVEIEGQRFCGCNTGFVYYTQWGPDVKTIRFVNWPIYSDVQGFVMSVVQEECPRRLQVPSLIGRKLAAIQPRQKMLTYQSDSRRCSYDYVNWLLSTQQHLVAHQAPACIRNWDIWLGLKWIYNEEIPITHGNMMMMWDINNIIAVEEIVDK